MAEETWGQHRAFLACCLAPQLLINARTLASRVVCKLASQIQWYPFFQPWGPIEGHKSSAFISNLGQIEKIFSISALTPSVKPLGG
jgi:hypothetical protein